MTRLIRVSAPAQPAVSLETFRRHVRVEHREEDLLMQSYLDAATAYLDGPTGVLGRCMVNQEWRQDFSGWSSRLPLRLPDVSATSIGYVDAAGDGQTVASENFEIVEEDTGASVIFARDFGFPALTSQAAYPVSVTMTAGFGAPGEVPAAIRQGIMMLAAHWRANRESVVLGLSATTVPLGFEVVVSPFRRVMI